MLEMNTENDNGDGTGVHDGAGYRHDSGQSISNSLIQLKQVE